MRLRIAALLILVSLPAHADIIGRARVIDGDTLKIGTRTIRLHGIDAPESGQSGLADEGRWQCGEEATNALVRIIGSNRVSCEERDRDRYGRIVAVCGLTDISGVSINARLVADGWAVAYRRFSDDYAGEEAQAKRSREGIWRGSFIQPQDWRYGKRLAVTGKKLGHCLIKGNIGRGGHRIYHVPGGMYYPRTRIDPSRGERCSAPKRRRTQLDGGNRVDDGFRARYLSNCRGDQPATVFVDVRLCDFVQLIIDRARVLASSAPMSRL